MIFVRAALAAASRLGSPLRHARRLSAEEVARLESPHLKNIRQVTFGLARAGRGIFQSRRPVDHLPGGSPCCRRRSSTIR